jgi:Ca2+-binding RTX toxin-like protein
VMIYDSGALVGSGVADANGAFSVASSVSLSNGSHALTAVAKSSNGLVSAASAALNVVIDTVGSVADVIDFSVAKYGKNSSSVTLSGTATDNSGCVVNVDVYRDGALQKTVAASSGSWSFGDLVSSGVHTYSMQATDTAGNVTAGAHSLVVGSANGETVRGTSGADYICGGAGYDTISGGGGNDVFVFGAGDAVAMTTSRNGRTFNVETITDFAVGDKLDVTDLGHLTFVGQTQAAGAGQLGWAISGGSTYVFADVNGDGVTDFMVRLIGLHTLTASDFLIV